MKKWGGQLDICPPQSKNWGGRVPPPPPPPHPPRIDAPDPTTIIEGDEFRKIRECQAAKQRELKKEGKGNKPNAARALTDEEVDILLGSANGEALLNTVWLNNTQHFG